MDWKPLVVSNNALHTCRLLVKCDFTFSTYLISVTDLSRTWNESLDRRQIIRRALNENTAIDPSEDASQLKILLEKVQAALDGAEGTSASFDTKPQRDELVLRVVSPLPVPLGTLEWPFHLSIQPEESVKFDLVLPLFHTAYVQQQQIKDLVVHLNEKDHVISKLLDKLESSGTDISAVFPGVSGSGISRRPTDRAKAARHVKGLGIFEEERWRGQSSGTFAAPQSVHEIISKLSTSTRIATSGAGFADGAIHDWWCHLGPSKREPATTPVPRPRNLPEKTPDTPGENIMDFDDDQFQRQLTSPELKKNNVEDKQGLRATAPSSSIPANDVDLYDETTDDEDDLDAPPKHSTQTLISKASVTPAPTASALAPKKPGVVIGSKSKVKEPTPVPGDQSRKDAESRPPTRDESTASPLASPMEASKSKLGVIGGRRALSKTPERTLSAPLVSSQFSPRKLGKIGGWKAGIESLTMPASQEKIPEPPIKAKIVSTPEPIQEETEEAMARRRREELKRTLEAKASAPVKRKRKF